MPANAAVVRPCAAVRLFGRLVIGDKRRSSIGSRSVLDRSRVLKGKPSRTSVLSHTNIAHRAARATLMVLASGHDGGPAKKKARRSSRNGEAVSPTHYGPVACTSAAAALVQAYLATDPSAAAATAAASAGTTATAVASKSVPATVPPVNGRGKKEAGSSGPRDSSDPCFLYMSESQFDPVKRRFGGKSKPVSQQAGVGDGTGNRGARLSFGPAAKVVATKEAMHTTLHCRCVFVLLCEVSSEGSAKSLPSSSSSAREHTRGAAARGVSGPPPSRSQRTDTAHLITLSPDDLFTALSVDSFPLSVASAHEKGKGNRGGAGGAPSDDGGGSGGSSGSGNGNGSSARRAQQVETAACALPRSFDVIDGPVVIHRPASRPGEPWRGLEIFRPGGMVAGVDSSATPWTGQRVPLAGGPGPPRHGPEGGGSDGPGGGGKGGGNPFRLNLSPVSATDSDATPPNGNPRRKRRAAGGGTGRVLLVCPPRDSSSSAGVDAELSGNVSRAWGGGRPGGGDESGAAVVALPAAVASPAAVVADGPGTGLPMPQWASLTVNQEGRGSLSTWRGLPLEWRSSLTCLCRAPEVDSGMVGLAGPALPGGAAERGLVLRSPPPTVYVGAAGYGGGAEPSSGSRRGEVDGGALFELQRGETLSCSRPLPASPWAVMTAAVDDARGVLVVLLADPLATALLLARDGSEFPVVEEYRGVAAAFTGDFLGNGREQVALLAKTSPATTATAASVGGGRRAAMKAGGVGWEQLPLKALVKRALVTDCSCIWGNGRRDDLAALSGAGPVQVVGVRPSGCSDGGAVGVSEAAGLASAGAKKRQRTMGREDADARKVRGTNGSPTAGSAAAASESSTRDGGGEDHRLDRLSTVVGVLRRRVQAEEMRLLRLRQARRGKMAAIEAAKVALIARVGTHFAGAGEDRDREAPSLAPLAAHTFYEGQVVPGDSSASMPPWIDEGAAGASSPPLQCSVTRVRFHAPSRTLCLDAHVSNPSPPRDKSAEESLAMATAASPVVVDVSFTVASPSGCLTTRSAVCPRLGLGESATVRACVDIPPGLLAGGGGGMMAGEAASLYVSCVWSLGDANAEESTKMTVATGARAVAAAGGAAAGEIRKQDLPATHAAIFARVLVSPKDFLGIGPLSSAAVTRPATAPETEFGAPSSRIPDLTDSSSGGGDGRRTGVASTSYSGVKKHLGLYDVGTRLDLLVRSDATASLAALPQAVRSLSAVASLPEPWAGGAAVLVGGCSEHTAECALRVGDLGSAAALLAVAGGALPDGASASADHASDQGRALIVAAASALRDEMEALEAVARERGRLGGSNMRGAGGDGGTVGAALSAALERYTSAQMRSDVLAARHAGRLVAAGGSGGTGAVGGQGSGRQY